MTHHMWNIGWLGLWLQCGMAFSNVADWITCLGLVLHTRGLQFISKTKRQHAWLQFY